MTRSRKSAKTQGTRFESLIASWLAEHVDPRVERRTRNGEHDRGDLSGVYLSPALGGKGVCIEAKDYGGRFLIAEWLREAETERGNADAAAGAVVAKRRGVTNAADQVVFMTVRDLAALLTGYREDE